MKKLIYGIVAAAVAMGSATASTAITYVDDVERGKYIEDLYGTFLKMPKFSEVEREDRFQPDSANQVDCMFQANSGISAWNEKTWAEKCAVYSTGGYWVPIGSDRIRYFKKGVVAVGKNKGWDMAAAGYRTKKLYTIRMRDKYPYFKWQDPGSKGTIEFGMESPKHVVKRLYHDGGTGRTWKKKMKW